MELIRQDILKIASNEIGYVEEKGNKTKYGKWFGFDGVAWCGIFVSWVYFTAGRSLGNIGFSKGFAGCQTFYEWAVKNNKVVNNPMPGDIVLFDWNKDKRFDHVGIFEKWISNESFNSIEGNTSLKNDSNGGSVMKRVRNVKSAVFVRVI